MNIKDLKYVAALIIATFVFILFRYTASLQKENKRLSNNQAVLLDSLQAYKIDDSLNVAKINVLELSLHDYKKYREEDVALIKKLKADKLSAAASVKTETVTIIKTSVKDSIVYKDTIKQFDYISKWTSIHGFLTNDSVNLKIENREELLLAESFVKKRFIGIKLPIKLFGYRTKSIDVVSKNPNTTINNLEYIQIYK